ncbi:MAG: malate dehydrogenase [Candidatus Omnitrophica bacterium]|nr:malate dehydrogenase [Candidatus Omnitrophota bacterium]MDD5027552.1 malate dehydrogenase [Candidatus Omnitrophota bacterium]MDD5661698.1 malate dehydrogenase [Candidatus Omnitrophota bacterium]
MKISIIGAGNVGALSAMRIAQYNLGDIFLVDIARGLARGKSLDLADAQAALGFDYNIQGSDDISSIKDSDIVVITAGLARKPGMTREELLTKNSQILKDVCVNIKELAPQAVVIVVTNPLDLMTYLALKTTGFAKNKVLGMGSSLDSSRLANLIARELKLSATSVETMVIGAHGEGMLPLARHTKIKGVSLEEFLSDEKMESLTKETIGRGAEIVALLGSGSAFFAPSAAVAQMVKIIAKDEKKIAGACAYLDGEYGIKDICLGVPCRLGRTGIEKIIELDLTAKEKKELLCSADSIRNLLKQLSF